MGFVESFVESYLREFADLEQQIENVFRNTFDSLNCSTTDRRYSIFRGAINSLRHFNNASKSIEVFENSLIRIENEILNFTMNPQVTHECFQPIRECAYEILKVFKTGLGSVNNKIEELFEEVYNSARGRKEDGIPFQALILDYFDVLFIHEFVREDSPRTRCRKIQIDGFYKKLDSFNARERTGFDFHKVLIECKNKKPDIGDLMQCFKYTLCFQMTETSKIPLVLMMCRSKPGRNSSIWEINKRIFDKKIENETRLILILTLDDLDEMKSLRICGLDPAKVIKDKITVFSQ